MKTYPFCNKENDDSDNFCSCGYYFNKQKYQQEVKQKEVIELKEKNEMKELKYNNKIRSYCGLELDKE